MAKRAKPGKAKAKKVKDLDPKGKGKNVSGGRKSLRERAGGLVERGGQTFNNLLNDRG